MTLPEKVRVLIVDDQPANRCAFGALLESKYAVATAESGPQALELALRDDYAIVLLDVRMPGMSGFEVAELLRQRERTRHTPIVLLSAFDKTVAHLKKGYAAGATDFIFSPVDEEVLKFKVDTYVELYLRTEGLKGEIDRLQLLLEGLKSKAASFSNDEMERDVRILVARIDALKRKMEATKAARR